MYYYKMTLLQQTNMPSCQNCNRAKVVCKCHSLMNMSYHLYIRRLDAVTSEVSINVILTSTKLSWEFQFSEPDHNY